jgi:Na+-transporting methylmalonyl-CoA/oxaloacetate decarboxylase gamma subunit
VGDLILKIIGAGFLFILLIIIGLVASGIGSVTIRNPDTGKERTWGKKD